MDVPMGVQNGWTALCSYEGIRVRCRPAFEQIIHPWINSIGISYLYFLLGALKKEEGVVLQKV